MKILIGADVVPTAQTERLFVDQDLQALFGEVQEFVKKVDRTVINLECALTTSNNEIKKYGPCLKADPKCADTLKSWALPT